MERPTAGTQGNGPPFAAGGAGTPTSPSDFDLRLVTDGPKGMPRLRSARGHSASSTFASSFSLREDPAGCEVLSSGDAQAHMRSRSHHTMRKSATEMAHTLREQLSSDLHREVEHSHWLVGSWQFKIAVAVLIFFNAILMGVEADYPELALWGIVENVFTACFFIEMVLKVSILKFAYFKEFGNLLDCSLVLVAVVVNWILALFYKVELQTFFFLRVFRILRLLRVMRIFREVRRFSLILTGIADALRTTFWVGALVCVCIYICAIFCTNFIGYGTEEVYPGYTEDHEVIDSSDIMQDFNPYVTFGSMSRSMLTLLNIVIFVEWSEVVRPVYEKQPSLIVFFIAFGLLVAFGVMNVIIGMIVDSVMQNARDMEAAFGNAIVQGKLDNIKHVQDLIRCFDCTHDNRVTQDELDSAMKCASMKRIVAHLGFPVGMTSQEFLSVLDDEGEGTLAFDSILPRLYRLITADALQKHYMLTSGMNSIKCSLKKQEAKIEETHEKMKSFEVLMLRLQSSTQPSTPPPATASGPTHSNDALASALSILAECSGCHQLSNRAATMSVPQAKVEAIDCICAKIELCISEVLGSLKALDETKPVLAATYCRTRLQEDLATCVEQLCLDTCCIGKWMPPLTEESPSEPATSMRKPPISIQDPGTLAAHPSQLRATASLGEQLRPSPTSSEL